ncbi:MAG: pyridoxal 5'-phosphate synthase glutaminase subunit PdxT [Candidatus Thermoplasmatota archaeon]|nr:pyridoxal 5'-phosphate synthase glutaminase subunit PdxT [Candidatus Thermoplasmatota archaeon]MCL5786283.1 pyridoxal 5'-phosphate synthase glutaminase subunit PdxT [Candidatus Thermoplasmatota archaeon]
MNVGIIGYQGDVVEHLELLEKLNKDYKREVNVVLVRNVRTLSIVDGLIIPGGESTTIYRLIKEFGLFDPIRTMAGQGIPIMGTCAGLVLISKDNPMERVRTLDLIDVSVRRNGYGRQGESFYENIDVDEIGSFDAVFIRAPIIERVGKVTVLARYNGSPVMVKEGNILGITFHPELTGDSRIHEMFLDMIGMGGSISIGKREFPMVEYV